MSGPKDRVQPSLRLEPSPRRVRTQLGGTNLADSTNVRLLYGAGGPPAYYFPRADVHPDALRPSDFTSEDPRLGRATYFHAVSPSRTVENAVRAFEQAPDAIADLRDLVTFEWKKMDAWFEEDEEVFVHPRDPYHRVDVRESSRHIRVEIDGETVAATQRPRLLFETSLPTRYYIPKLDVRMDLLAPTETHSACPYKGEASYWSVRIAGNVHKDVAWGYPYPLEECAKIAGLVCFYNHRVTLYVDGDLQENPTNRH